MKPPAGTVLLDVRRAYEWALAHGLHAQDMEELFIAADASGARGARPAPRLVVDNGVPRDA